MLIEASHALAHLDADGLEEMALSCATLIRDADKSGAMRRTQYKSGPEESLQEMAIFASVLEATRANLNVMRRLRQADSAQLEYGPAQAARVLSETEMEHGDH